MSFEGRRGVVLLGIATLAAAVASCGFDVQLVASAGAGGHGAVTVTTGVDPISSGVGGEGSSAFSASSGVGSCDGLPVCAQCSFPSCSGGTCTEQSGFCDDFGDCLPDLPGDCVKPDECGGAACGTPCTGCVPGGDVCAPGACDGFGNCLGFNQVACPSSYRPCAALGCGDSCSVCDPKMDPTCVDPGAMTVCSATGQCDLPEYSGCDQDSCAGASCDEPCWLCNPMDPGCQMAMMNQPPVGACDMFGKCLVNEAPYCACPPMVMGCTLPCTACAPMDPGCEEPDPPSVCDSDGACVSAGKCN